MVRVDPDAHQVDVALERLYRVAHVAGDLETLEAEDGSLLVHDRAASTLDGHPVRRQWSSWSEVLTACLGPDPLALPPGGDTGAFRKLLWREKAGTWVLELSGLNRCSMSGVVGLKARRDEVDVSGLVVDGVAWSEGGAFRAKTILRAELRDLALATWPDMDPEERLRTLRSLRSDPDAEATLEELEARYGPLSP